MQQLHLQLFSSCVKTMQRSHVVCRHSGFPQWVRHLCLQVQQGLACPPASTPPAVVAVSSGFWSPVKSIASWACSNSFADSAAAPAADPAEGVPAAGEVVTPPGELPLVGRFVATAP